MRVTFAKRIERGLGMGPKLYSISVDGKEVGSIQEANRMACIDEWFWYANWNGRRMNTSGKPALTLAAAKAEVKAWLKAEGGKV